MLKKCPKSSWQLRNFSVMFTTGNEIIRSSWRKIYRLSVTLSILSSNKNNQSFFQQDLKIQEAMYYFCSSNVKKQSCILNLLTYQDIWLLLLHLRLDNDCNEKLPPLSHLFSLNISFYNYRLIILKGNYFIKRLTGNFTPQ